MDACLLAVRGKLVGAICNSTLGDTVVVSIILNYDSLRSNSVPNLLGESMAVYKVNLASLLVSITRVIYRTGHQVRDLPQLDFCDSVRPGRTCDVFRSDEAVDGGRILRPFLRAGVFHSVCNIRH